MLETLIERVATGVLVLLIGFVLASALMLLLTTEDCLRYEQQWIQPQEQQILPMSGGQVMIIPSVPGHMAPMCVMRSSSRWVWE